MWETGEGCGNRKRKTQTVIDRDAQKNSVPIETKNTSFYAFWLFNLRNSQNRGSEPVSVAITESSNGSSSAFLSSGFDPLSAATTESNHASSDLGNSQNPGSDYVSISKLSERFGLLAKVENHANKIFRQVEVQIRCKGKKKRNALIAACIFIACRQMDTTRSVEEISCVANEAKPFDISEAVGALAETLGLDKNSLLHIEPADFTTRFCNALEVDSQGVKAAHETAKRYSNKVDSSMSPVSVAAAIAYHTALDYHERKLLNGIIQASGVEESTIIQTYREFYPYPSTIAPEESPAKAKDMKKLDST